MTPFCAAIDWGTSSFRLWLLSEDGAVIAERRSDEGMIRAAAAGFDAVLERHLADLGAAKNLPVIICGMAGARQGWREAGYLDTPADVTGIIRDATIIDGYPRDVRILPGIAQRNANAPDVMRGEETQLLGLAADGVRSGLICMPGTHSKWVTLAGDKVEGFSTFMTGELFDILSRHSILSAAMRGASEILPDDMAFLAAVKLGFAQSSLSNLLFHVRAAQLLGFAPASDSAARLSGLLIGHEFAGAMPQGAPHEVVLAASGGLGSLYRAGLEGLGVAVRYCDAADAVRRGLWSAARAFWAGEERQSHGH